MSSNSPQENRWTLRADARGESTVVVLSADAPVIHTVQDALDLMADARHRYDSGKLLLHKGGVCEAFFDLRSGLAGEILQKYTNYGVRVAFVGDFSIYDSRALRDFIRESNRGGRVLFSASESEALEALHREL